MQVKIIRAGSQEPLGKRLTSLGINYYSSGKEWVFFMGRLILGQESEKPRAFWLRADESFQFNTVLHAKSKYAKGVTVYDCSDFRVELIKMRFIQTGLS